MADIKQAVAPKQVTEKMVTPEAAKANPVLTLSNPGEATPAKKHEPRIVDLGNGLTAVNY